MNFKSFAKLNLNLYVSPPQVGGLHRLASIFQLISLYDEVYIVPSEDRHNVIFENQDVPEINTCTKVFELLQFKLNKFWSVKIVKHIPSGAGLGGGSSNAAYLINALNRLESLNLTISEMESIAAQVGSDVPYFLHGGQAKVSGIGEIIEPNVSYIDCPYFVLILPNIHCSTAGVYQTLDTLGDFDDLNCLSESHLEAIGFNRLLQPAFTIAPELKSLYLQVVDLLSGNVFMSGSGSTLFIPCSSQDDQTHIKEKLDSTLVSFDGQILLSESVY